MSHALFARLMLNTQEKSENKKTGSFWLPALELNSLEFPPLRRNHGITRNHGFTRRNHGFTRRKSRIHYDYANQYSASRDFLLQIF